jgi:hypothetical protein
MTQIRFSKAIARANAGQGAKIAGKCLAIV